MGCCVTSQPGTAAVSPPTSVARQGSLLVIKKARTNLDAVFVNGASVWKPVISVSASEEDPRSSALHHRTRDLFDDEQGPERRHISQHLGQWFRRARQQKIDFAAAAAGCSNSPWLSSCRSSVSIENPRQRPKLYEEEVGKCSVSRIPDKERCICD